MKFFIRLVAMSALALLLVSGVATAQQGVTWVADYFNNPVLQGSPDASQQGISSVSFDWGAGSPADNIQPNNFSARFGTNAYFEGGTYRFYLRADDGVRLAVDFDEKLNTLNEPQPGQTVTVDVPLSTGTHHLQIDYRERTGLASIFFDWERIDGTGVAPVPVDPVDPAPPTFVDIPSSTWTARYYANQNLQGTPTVVLNTDSPTNNWGLDAPVGGIPADNFSVRWTSLQTLDPGEYEIRVRADDGVRVYIDNVPYIDEWHAATGATYTARVALTGGQYNFTVDFYEDTGAAFLQYQIVQLTNTAPVVDDPPVQVADATATVTAYRLNVRERPDPFADNQITEIARGNRYPVIGRTPDGDWWEIRLPDGTRGWVSGDFVNVVVQPGETVPVTSTLDYEEEIPQPTDYISVATEDVNIRTGPGINNGILDVLEEGQAAQVVGRNLSNTWWLVEYGDVTGWVFNTYARLLSDVDSTTLPVRG